MWEKENSPRNWGGKREGAGRPVGSKSTKHKIEYSKRTEMFTKRITKEEKVFLEQKLEEFRKTKSE